MTIYNFLLFADVQNFDYGYKKISSFLYKSAKLANTNILVFLHICWSAENTLLFINN